LSSTQVVLVYTLEQRFFIDDFPEFLISGVFAGIIANGIIPLLEKILGIATIYKLTELNKYDHPILEELYKKARGTYEHSRNVAHLVSVASNKIGTNTLLLKVAALYHDLGKIENAEFFIENSTPSSNIHNIITPLESAKIILEHPKKSIEICYKNKIPKEVIDLIETHHGDSVLMHFYQKELEINENADINDFTYSTPTPKTKEQGILLLADATEAFSRSQVFKTEKELEEILRTFIYKKIKKGELRNCELTTKEIEICIEEFTEAIFVTQHKRVPYSTEKVEKV
jgi:putative nucleotidyltransferase with HDIG domain